MLVPAAEQEGQGGLTQAAARWRRGRAEAAGGGAGIGTLRAGGWALGDVSDSALVQPPPAARGMLDQLRGQVAPSNPLNGGLTPERFAGDGPLPTLGVLQAGLARARLDFSRLDGASRALLASRSPRRTQNGFGFRLYRATLDLLG